ncbi:MAG: M20 family metallo-hydrolase [Syntrophales bacterium]
MTDYESIAKRIDSYRDDMIRLQTELTAIPAISPESGGDGESEKSSFLEARLRDMGFTDIRLINALDRRVSSGVRPNLVVTLRGRNPGKSTWILTHMDVVPPGELSFWSSDPYKARVDDGKIYGRGTEDNQQDMVASIFAAKAFLDAEITPPNTIRLAIVSDEETGSEWGLKYLLKAEPSLFGKSDIYVVPDFGSESGDKIEVAEKSILWLRFKTTGKQCHASRPDLGLNAFRAASHLVVRLDDLHRSFALEDTLFDPPASTFEPTRKDPNVSNVNTIPGEDVFYMDSRVLPFYRLEDVLSEIRMICDETEKRFGVTIEFSPVQQSQAPPATRSDAPVVIALQSAVKTVYGVEPIPVGIGGGTIAACLRSLDYPAAVWCRLGLTAHQPNEYCTIENMIGNAKVYACLFLHP